MNSQQIFTQISLSLFNLLLKHNSICTCLNSLRSSFISLRLNLLTLERKVQECPSKYKLRSIVSSNHELFWQEFFNVRGSENMLSKSSVESIGLGSLAQIVEIVGFNTFLSSFEKLEQRSLSSSVVSDALRSHVYREVTVRSTAIIIKHILLYHFSSIAQHSPIRSHIVIHSVGHLHSLIKRKPCLLRSCWEWICSHLLLCWLLLILHNVQIEHCVEHPVPCVHVDLIDLGFILNLPQNSLSRFLISFDKDTQ